MLVRKDDGAADGGGGGGGGADAAAAGGADAGGEEKVTYAGKYETVEALEAGYAELHKKFGAGEDAMRESLTAEITEQLSAKAREHVPETADGYEFTPAEGLIPEGYELSFTDQESFGTWKTMAHEIGLSPEQFNQITGLYVQNELSMLPVPSVEKGKLGENADLRIERVEKFLQANLDEDNYDSLRQHSGEASFIMAMEKLIEKSSDSGFRHTEGDDATGDEPVSESSLQKLMQHKGYRDPMHPEHNELQRKVREGFQKLTAGAA